MLRSSILTLRHKISGHKVSMSRHSTLCHNNRLRRCVANKAECAHDRGALPHTTKELCHPRQRSSVTHDRTGGAQLGCAYNKGASAIKVDRLVQKQNIKYKK